MTRDSTCTHCITPTQNHALALDGYGNFATLANPLKKSEEVNTVEFAFKALRLKGVQGLLCDREQVLGSLCLRLIKNHLAITVFGNHITSQDPVISGSTHLFDFDFKPFTGYKISVVYGLLRKGMAYTKLYVDGKPISTKFFASGHQPRLGTAIVGGLEGHTKTYFQGFIDDLRIWNIPRMAWQIQRDFNHEIIGVEHGLVAYFPFNNPSVHADSLGVSHWEMDIHGAVYTDPFPLGRRN